MRKARVLITGAALILGGLSAMSGFVAVIAAAYIFHSTELAVGVVCGLVALYGCALYAAVTEPDEDIELFSAPEGAFVPDDGIQDNT